MMVEPGWYYEEKLKGKNVDQIKKEIRSLKGKIGHLKKMVANLQEYLKEWIIKPDPKVRLKAHRLYLQKATKAFVDIIEQQDV